MPYVVEERNTTSKYGIVWEKKDRFPETPAGKAAAETRAKEYEEALREPHRVKLYTTEQLKGDPGYSVIVTPETRKEREDIKRIKEYERLAGQALKKSQSGMPLSEAEKMAAAKQKKVELTIDGKKTILSGKAAISKLQQLSAQRSQEKEVQPTTRGEIASSFFERMGYDVKSTSKELRAAGDQREVILKAPSSALTFKEGEEAYATGRVTGFQYQSGFESQLGTSYKILPKEEFRLRFAASTFKKTGFDVTKEKEGIRAVRGEQEVVLSGGQTVIATGKPSGYKIFPGYESQLGSGKMSKFKNILEEYKEGKENPPTDIFGSVQTVFQPYQETSQFIKKQIGHLMRKDISSATGEQIGYSVGLDNSFYSAKKEYYRLLPPTVEATKASAAMAPFGFFTRAASFTSLDVMEKPRSYISGKIDIFVEKEKKQAKENLKNITKKDKDFIEFIDVPFQAQKFVSSSTLAVGGGLASEAVKHPLLTRAYFYGFDKAVSLGTEGIIKSSPFIQRAFAKGAERFLGITTSGTAKREIGVLSKYLYSDVSLSPSFQRGISMGVGGSALIGIGAYSVSKAPPGEKLITGVGFGGLAAGGYALLKTYENIKPNISVGEIKSELYAEPTIEYSRTAPITKRGTIQTEIISPFIEFKSEGRVGSRTYANILQKEGKIDVVYHNFLGPGEYGYLTSINRNKPELGVSLVSDIRKVPIRTGKVGRPRIAYDVTSTTPYERELTFSHELLHYKTNPFIPTLTERLPYRARPSELISFGLEKRFTQKGFSVSEGQLGVLGERFTARLEGPLKFEYPRIKVKDESYGFDIKPFSESFGSITYGKTQYSFTGLSEGKTDIGVLTKVSGKGEKNISLKRLDSGEVFVRYFGKKGEVTKAFKIKGQPEDLKLSLSDVSFTGDITKGAFDVKGATYNKFFKNYISNLENKGYALTKTDNDFLLFSKGESKIKVLKKDLRETDFYDFRLRGDEAFYTASGFKKNIEGSMLGVLRKEKFFDIEKSFISKAASRMTQTDIAEPYVKTTRVGKETIVDIVPADIKYAFQPQYKPNLKEYDIENIGGGLQSVSISQKRPKLSTERKNIFKGSTVYAWKDQPKSTRKILKSFIQEEEGMLNVKGILERDLKKEKIYAEIPRAKEIAPETQPIFSKAEIENALKYNRPGSKVILTPISTKASIEKTISIARPKSRAVSKSILDRSIISRARSMSESKSISKVSPISSSVTISKSIRRTLSQSKTSTRTEPSYNITKKITEFPKTPVTNVFLRIPKYSKPQKYEKDKKKKKRPHAGTPSLGVVLGGEGIKLTPGQIKGTDIINPFIQRRIR